MKEDEGKQGRIRDEDLATRNSDAVGNTKEQKVISLDLELTVPFHEALLSEEHAQVGMADVILSLPSP